MGSYLQFECCLITEGVTLIIKSLKASADKFPVLGKKRYLSNKHHKWCFNLT